MKKVFGFLFVIFATLIMTSCKNQTDWSDSNGYVNAKQLESTYKKTDNKLVIDINNKDDYLSNVNKDKIIVKAKNNSDIEEKTLTAEALKNNAINDYELDVTSGNVKVTLPNYDNTTYIIVFNKSITKDNSYAYSYVSLIEETYTEQSYIVSKEDDYLVGETNPEFNIIYKNMDVVDKTKISFFGGLEDLKVTSCDIDDENIKIKTSGTISQRLYGSLILEKGFFTEENELEITYELNEISYNLDAGSIDLNDNVLSFDIVFSNREFDTVSNDIIVIDDFDISKIEVLKPQNNVLRVYTSYNGSLDDAVMKLSNSTIHYNDLNYNDFDASANINFPSYNIYTTLNGNKLMISFRYNDAEVESISEDLIMLNSDDIRLSGENKNSDIVGFYETSNGFDLELNLDNELDNVSATFGINGDKDLFKTLWGTRYSAPLMAFSCANKKALTNQGEFDEAFSEKVIKAKPSVDTFAKSLQFVGYSVQLGCAISGNNTGQAIGAALNLLKMFGLSGSSEDPSIKDVLNKLEDISNLVKSVDRKIDSLKQQMLDNDTAIRLGIDKTLFNQYRGFWDKFYEAYIETSEDLLRDYTTDTRSYFVDFVRDTNDCVLTLKFFNDGTNTVFAMENPNDLGYSLEGYKYVSSTDVTIQKSYFEPVAELTRKARGYTDDFDTEFVKCLRNNLKANYKDLSESKLEELVSNTYSHIVGLSQRSAITETMAKKMRNLFINYANHISGKATGTSYLVYYNMMLESLYNFQSEAKDEMMQIRVNVKKLLDKYAGFATIMADFCPGIDKEAITTAYNDAYDYINKNDNLVDVKEGEDYSYVLNSKISAKVVRCSFDKGYNKANTNDCEFYYNYRTYDVSTNKTIDVVNNSKLVTDSDFAIMYARIQNVARLSGQSDNISLYNYLKQKGLITDSLIKLYDGKEVITSYGGINSLSSKNFNVICTSCGMGYYFGFDKVYRYESEYSSGCWSGREATGNIYDLDSRTIVSNTINRMARYDESHWYWGIDEHWAFEEFKIGRYSLVFIKN